MTRISGAGRGGGQVGAAGGERGGAVGALLPEPGYPPRGARRPRPLGPPGSRPPGCLRRLQGAFRYCHVNSTSEAMPFRWCCLRGLEGASGAFRCCRVSLLSLLPCLPCLAAAVSRCCREELDALGLWDRQAAVRLAVHVGWKRGAFRCCLPSCVRRLEERRFSLPSA